MSVRVQKKVHWRANSQPQAIEWLDVLGPICQKWGVKNSPTKPFAAALCDVSEAVVVLDSADVVVAFSPAAENVVSGLALGVNFSVMSLQQPQAILVLRPVAKLNHSTPAHSNTYLGQQSRLESLGSIASGVAHDINNIVTGVLGHVSYLRLLLGDAGKHAESLKTIEEGGKRAAALSQQILRFSKAEEQAPARIDLREVVTSTVALLRAALPPGCALSNSLPKTVCGVLAIETQLSQIVMNLIVNSRDAAGSNGQIEVLLASVNDPEELSRAFRGADRSSNSYIRLLVADNGSGMPEEVKRRMFEPYFSTKKGQGTGLGLATVNQIVKQFGGAIVVNSSLGRGTTIAVYLPEVVGPVAFATKAESAARDGHGRILVIDDEYSVRNVLCLSLEHLGYEVIVASGGAEALDIYRARTESFDLVLLDMLMPEMSGAQVFTALKMIDPDVAVLVVSGFAAGSAIEAILDGGGLDYLPKPFTIEELALKVRSCLE